MGVVIGTPVAARFHLLQNFDILPLNAISRELGSHRTQTVCSSRSSPSVRARATKPQLKPSKCRVFVSRIHVYVCKKLPYARICEIRRAF